MIRKRTKVADTALRVAKIKWQWPVGGALRRKELYGQTCVICQSVLCYYLNTDPDSVWAGAGYKPPYRLRRASHRVGAGWYPPTRAVTHGGGI